MINCISSLKPVLAESVYVFEDLPTLMSTEQNQADL
jgi:hypothetical protein